MIPGLAPTDEVRRAIEEHAIERGSSGPEAAAQAAATLHAWIQNNAIVMGYQTTLRWVAVFSLAALAAALAIPFTLARAADHTADHRRLIAGSIAPVSGGGVVDLP
ncbi:MAG TPA: hypothetical protein VMS64_20665 [Candidatus Methylomirabilis sp.]|nr:hypothetical protein [Candidatus Methylomirabilis sp.]